MNVRKRATKTLTVLDILNNNAPTKPEPTTYARLKQEIVEDLTAVIETELRALEARLLKALRK